jgi:hypothetical protein
MRFLGLRCKLVTANAQFGDVNPQIVKLLLFSLIWSGELRPGRLGLDVWRLVLLILDLRPVGIRAGRAASDRGPFSEAHVLREPGGKGVRRVPSGYVWFTGRIDWGGNEDYGGARTAEWKRLDHGAVPLRQIGHV